MNIDTIDKKKSDFLVIKIILSICDVNLLYFQDEY